MSKEPKHPDAKEYAEIILRASKKTGSISSAVAWFECRPIPGLGNKTAAEVVADGDSDAVLQHLDDLDEGTFV